MALQDEVDGGIEQGTTRTDQLRTGLLVHPVFVEADALIPLEHRGSHPNVTVPFPQDGGYVSYLPPPFLSTVDLATKAGKSIEEKRLDVMWLEPAGMSLLHLLLDLLNTRGVHGVVDQGSLVQDLLQVLAIDSTIDCLVESSFHFRVIAVADCFHQQVA